MKTTLKVFAGASFLALCLLTKAVAIPIVGSIAFNGTPNFNTLPISAATAIVSYDSAWVATDQQTGDYAAVPDMLPVAFSPFTFSPATQAVNPLWTFGYAGDTYSFTTTSMIAIFNATLNIWNLGGTGVLHITGHDDTHGIWNLSAGQIGNSFYFGSAAASTGIQVPDTGMTLLLLCLGLGLVGLAKYSRRMV